MKGVEPRTVPARHQVGAALFKHLTGKAEAGGRDGRTREFVRLAISIGPAMKGATHDDPRRAWDQGATADEMCHVALLALTTPSFPSMMRRLPWMEDVVAPS